MRRKVGGSLGGKELEILRLTRQAVEEWSLGWLLTEPSARRKVEDVGVKVFIFLLAGRGALLTHPPPLTAATGTATALLGLSVQFLNVRGLTGLHSGGRAEGLGGDLGLEHSLGD